MGNTLMNSESENQEFLTVAEVAALLKINEQTVRNWIDRGELAAVRAGRRVRIRRSALDEVLTAVSEPKPPSAESIPEGPSGDDFWGGVAVGSADLVPTAPSSDLHEQRHREATSMSSGTEKPRP
jgi:excisionase family DNA binding protein